MNNTAEQNRTEKKCVNERNASQPFEWRRNIEKWKKNNNIEEQNRKE